MSSWKLVNKTLIYDGSFYGLLTIVFDCFSSKTLPAKICSRDCYVNNFLDDVYYIDTDEIKSQRVFDGMYAHIGYDAVYNSFYAFLSNNINKEMDILKYLCDGFEVGPKINQMLTISYFSNVMAMRKRALSECHRLKGLLRFIETKEHLFYASIHPDNNILEPLGHHFMRRFPTQDFIIHDKNRNLCFLYHNDRYEIVDGNNFVMPDISSEEKQYQNLWRAFFDTISIKERKNPRCQMQFMHKKYWKDLIEKPI